MKVSNAIKVHEFGLDVIYRHDYNTEQSNISEYVEKSCKYLDKFLDNVVGSEDYKVFLDIGCGNAQAIDYFEKNRGYLAYGVDLYPQQHDSRIFATDFYKLSENYAKNSIDVIFCNHTLEHSLAPLLLEQIRIVHKIGGTIFIAVPDADYSWAYDITSSTTHWSIFNAGFLRHLLTKYGYECHVEKKCFRENKGELFLVGVRRW